MSNWRPEGWDESSEATAKQCAEDEKFKVANLENVIRGMFETGADAMLLKVCEEIEKVECGHYASGYSEEAQDIGKRNMKQKVLALFK